MTDSLRLLLIPTMIAVGWFVARQSNGIAHQSARFFPLALATLLVVVALAGVGRASDFGVTAHRWTSQVLVLATWLVVPFAAGISLQQNIRKRPVVTIAHVIVLFFLLGAILLTSLTGYLGPSHVNPPVEETNNRFRVLHWVVLPFIDAILLVACYGFTKLRTKYAA